MGIANLLFPPACPVCSRVLRSEDSLFCRNCAKQLPKPGPRSDQNAYYRDVIAPFAYVEPIRTYILDLKFNGMSKYASPLGICVADEIIKSGAGFDYISWVPVSTSRLMKRKYDQAKLIAEAAAKYTSKNCVPTLLRIRNTKANSSLSGVTKRADNVRGAFEALDADIEGKNILLIDDVITSGSTMNECARILIEAGAKRVTAGAVCSVNE